MSVVIREVKMRGIRVIRLGAHMCFVWFYLNR